MLMKQAYIGLWHFWGQGFKVDQYQAYIE